MGLMFLSVTPLQVNAPLMTQYFWENSDFWIHIVLTVQDFGSFFHDQYAESHKSTVNDHGARHSSRH